MSLVERLRVALSSDTQLAELMVGDWPEGAGIEDGLITPAAVLVPIIDRPDPGVILTVRTDTVRRHAGQIAFPGGRIDPEDEDAVAAALREAEEEIGLPRTQVQVIGTADRYRTVTGFDVTPVLGTIPSGLEFTLQPDEVAAVFEAPLLYLLEPAHQHKLTVEWEGRERSYYEIVWEGRRIWGATAAMIVNLSRRLAPAL
jgi:8-oxo-dGTP pyrophosphatase MutT (NUDIX family)